MDQISTETTSIRLNLNKWKQLFNQPIPLGTFPGASDRVTFMGLNIYILSRNIYFPKLSLQIFNLAGNARVCELVFVATFEGAFSEYLAVFDLFSYMKWYMTNSSSMASLLQILTLASTTVLANKSLFIHYSLLAIFETI